MKMLVVAMSAGELLVSTAAFAQPMATGRAGLLSSVPPSSLTVTDWYKQHVYDQANAKIGDINDVLVGPNGEVNAAHRRCRRIPWRRRERRRRELQRHPADTKDDKIYLTMDTTKDALEERAGLQIRQRQDELGPRE